MRQFWTQGAVAAFAIAFFASVAAAQTAYYSLVGNLNAAGAQENFTFSLSQSVSSAQTFGFITYANHGGTNNNSDTIPSGGIDSVLQLFDSASASRGINDDYDTVNKGRDSLLSFPGLTPNPGGVNVPLNPNPLLTGTYRLNLSAFGNSSTGAWALDLVSPASPITLTRIESVGNSTVDSLSFGSSTSASPARLILAADLTLLDKLELAHFGGASLTLNGGSLTVGGVTTINSGATVSIPSNTFTANNDVFIPGGTLSRTGGSFNLAANKKLTASSSGQVNFTGSYTLNNGTTLEFDTGAHLAVTSFLDIGTAATTGTLIIDGQNSLLTTNSLDTTFVDWGFNGGTANVTVRNKATATISASSIQVARGGSGTGTINVESGAAFTGNTILLASSTGGSGTIKVDGLNSTLTQNGVSSLTVGGGVGSTSTAVINVQNSGIFNTGTGVTTINKTGTVNIASSGIFNQNGDINIDGGTLNRTNSDSLSFNLAAGKKLTASNQGQLGFTGNYTIRNNSTFEIDSDADFTLTDRVELASFGTGSGTLIVDGMGSTLTTNTVNTAFADWGLNGAANVTIRNKATATINANSIEMTRLAQGGSAIFNIESGAVVTTKTINLAPSTAGTATIKVDGVNSSLTLSGASTLSVGGAGGSTAVINVQNSGVFTTGTGLTTVNKTGTININSNFAFHQNGDINIAGGTLNRLSTGALDFDLAAGKKLTASGNGHVNFTGDYTINNGNTFEFDTGANFLVTTSLYVGKSGETGTLIVDGSTLTTNTTDTTSVDWGFDHGTANVTVRNKATATINADAIVVARVFDTGSATINVESGANFTAKSLDLASGAGGSATVKVDSATLTQSGASTLTVGGAGGIGGGAGSTAVVNVQNSGIFNTGTGVTNINKTGTVNIASSGVFNQNGNINIVGGTLNRTESDPSSFNLAAGKKLTASSGGQVNFTGGYDIEHGTTLEFNTDADFILSGPLDIGVLSDGTLIVDGQGSSLTDATDGSSIWGASGNAVITIRKKATATYSPTINMGLSAAVATLNIESGASFTAKSIQLGTNQEATATIKVDGANTSLLQTGTSTLTIGASGNSTSTAFVNIQNSGVFTTGTGATTINRGGTINLSSGALRTVTIDNTHGGQFNFTGGTLNVATFQGDVTQAGGTLAPGETPGSGSVLGTTAVTGNYSITNPAAALDIDIAGKIAGTFDRVNVTGTATLQGTLTPTLLAFTPAPTDSFTFMTYAHRGAIFDTIANSQINAQQSWSVNYAATQATLLAGEQTGGTIDGVYQVPGKLLIDGAFQWNSTLIKVGAGDLDIDISNVTGVGPGAMLAIAEGTVRLDGHGVLTLSGLQFGDLGLATGDLELVGTFGFYSSVVAVPEPGLAGAFAIVLFISINARRRSLLRNDKAL